MSDKIKTSHLQALGIYRIIGGILGLGFLFFLLIQTSSYNLLLFLILFVALTLYSYSIFCGVLLLRKIKSGLKHSYVNQILQVINFSISGYAFQYVAGVFISVGCDLSESFYLKFNIGLSTWNMNINSGNSELIVNLNLVAVFPIVFLDRMKSKIKKNKIEKQISGIGIDEAHQPT